MDLLTILNAAALIAILIALIWLATIVLRMRSGADTSGVQHAVESLKAELIGKQMEGLVALRESLDSASRGLNERLAEGTSSLDRRLAVVSEIENKLGQLQRQTEHLQEIGQNIQQLADLLKPPKLRGGLGELLLENLLSQILPPALFETQYSFAGGQRVDAVIKLGDRLLPIDSKFPLEAFQRLTGGTEGELSHKEFAKAIKVQVDNIAGKYLLPEQNTTDFAVMYIPSEAVYYRLVADEDSDLLSYALAKKVIPSSPGHLYAFLASVAAVAAEAGLAGNRREVSAVLSSLGESLARLDGLHQRMAGSARVLGLSLDKARGETETMQRRLDGLKELAPAETGTPGHNNEYEDTVDDGRMP